MPEGSVSSRQTTTANVKISIEETNQVVETTYLSNSARTDDYPRGLLSSSLMNKALYFTQRDALPRIVGPYKDDDLIF